MSEDKLHLPSRPGFGTQGIPVKLHASYCELEASNEVLLYRYCIEVTTQRHKQVPLLIVKFLQEYFAEYINVLVTDYKSVLLCSKELPIRTDPYVIFYTDRDRAKSTDSCQIRIIATGKIIIPKCLDKLTANTLNPSERDVIQALNIIFSHHPKSSLDIHSIGSNRHFDLKSGKLALDSGLLAAKGVFVSIRAMAAPRLLVNINSTYSIWYQEGLLSDLISAYMKDQDSNMSQLAAFIKGVRVRLAHHSSKSEGYRIKKITGLATSIDGDELAAYRPVVPRLGASSVEVKFYLNITKTQVHKKEVYISVSDFFSTTYRIHLNKPHLPVVNVGSSHNPIYLPPELCVVLPGQPCNVELANTRQKAQFIKFALQEQKRGGLSTISTAMGILGIQSPQTTLLKSFNLNVNPKWISIPGRVLPRPNVEYRNCKQVTPRSGNWSIRSMKLSLSKRLSYWTYLWISSGDSGNAAWSSETELMNSLGIFRSRLDQLGIQTSMPAFPGIHLKLTGTNEKAIVSKTFNRLFNNNSHRPPPTFLLVILRSSRDPIYNHIKLICDVKRGIHNICVIGHNLAKARSNDVIWTNMALKLNLKLGGRNQCLQATNLGLISEGKTMVVGIDVSHPAPGAKANEPSIAAVVASVDSVLSQWPADISIQEGGQEMVLNLENMLQSRLHLWAESNGGVYPENILIYRDGVSEGQYEKVLTEELPLCQKACNAIYGTGKARYQKLPRICIVIVAKNHHTRFFRTTNPGNTESSPLNGTVVDHGVTEAGKWDFYLQAHAANQGVARPIHYVVIFDEIFRSIQPQAPFKNPADILETLTYNMCYLSGRCTKVIRVCPPVFYADLVCGRARRYLLSGTEDDNTRPSGMGVKDNENKNHVGSAGSIQIHQNVRRSMFYI